ncbi:VOC family protein [Methanocella conradii]|uniref:VOC family protein n=1 Tax=Methanocella conradii TaxID=1175444 RepID=UPI00157D5F43|nr:VOC family protein [Methanocella conradii]
MHTVIAGEKVNTMGLCHIAIDVSDIERSLKFYTEMFDMDVLDRTDRFIHLRTHGGHDSFFLFRADGPVNPRKGGLTYMHFGFKVDDENFEKALEYINKHDVKVHPNPARGPGRYVYIEDPDGYVIQLEPGTCE